MIIKNKKKKFNLKLKLIPDKTELVVFGSPVQWKQLDSFLPVNILVNLLDLAEIKRNLSVIFDADLILVCVTYVHYFQKFFGSVARS